MGNNEQLCVDKELHDFHVHGDKCCVIKMFIEQQCISE
jgi:hypothetical protein